MPAVEIPSDTPLMRQHRELKDLHPGAILFFRLGDFYEMFGEDARAAAPVCGLLLTSRQGIPMCGVPRHNYKQYLARLLKAGFKVALAEQLEEPSKAKKIVLRGVTRLVTPGTLIEEELLEPAATNYLVAVALDIVGWGAAVMDVSTGEFWATQALNDPGSRRLYALLGRLGPAEVLLTSSAAETLRLRERLLARAALTLDDEPPPDPAAAPWARESAWTGRPLALQAALRARRYVARARFFLKEPGSPSYRESGEEMQLDETAVKTLELVCSASGDRRHSLLGLLDRCRTPMGSRRLKAWILHPSTDLREIEQRQNCVEELLGEASSRDALSRALAEVADISRALQRLSTTGASPRDLAALRGSLRQLPALQAWLSATEFCSALKELLEELREASAALLPCRELIEKALAETPSSRLTDGGVIRDGFDAELDELRLLKSDSRGFLAKLEASERQASSIPSLKAGYNSVFGYYFEVTKAHQAKVPERYIRKQTLTNAERYITPELKELETKILSAEDRMLRLEARLFDRVREQTLGHHAALARLAEILAELDVLNALAEAAHARGYVKPKVTLNYGLDIRDGRHPVLESLLPAGRFVPNSVSLDGDARRIAILTGPNMSGKSTYLRQNALIVIMAQIGSFVPAASAEIGLVDKVLTRIGAQDSLAEGASTFMVEMRETAHILRSATPRSLLILDEVGRGTSTFDGISIAWAVIEHLHSAYDERGAAARGPRVLFATHYFELTALADVLDGVANFNVEAKEWTDSSGRTEVVFLHKISPGPADRSYGIHVAALAGLPASALARAKEILSKLEAESASGKLAAPVSRPDPEPKLPLFDEHPALETLRLLNPEAMTPLDALSALAALKKKL